MSNPNPNTQCSVNTVAMGSLVVSTTSSSSSTAQIVLSSKEPNSVVSCCSNSCSGGQPDEASCKDDRSKVPNTEPNKPEREIDEAKNQEIEKMEIKEEAEDGGAESAAVRGEGDDGERKSGKEKEKEVIVLDDSLDDDFKQTKKRFRTPAATTKDGPVSYIMYICMSIHIVHVFMFDVLYIHVMHRHKYMYNVYRHAYVHNVAIIIALLMNVCISADPEEA